MSNFFSKYKLLLLLVFVFSFCIPTNVFALNYCFYFEGSSISEKCMNGNKELDCPEDGTYQITKDSVTYSVYPKNLVGAYKTTKSDCIIPDKNYYLEGKQLLANDPLELQFNSFLSAGEDKMENTTAGQSFKKNIIKKQLNFIIENTCCVPIESSKNDPRFACGKPTIKYTDTEMLKLNFEDFYGDKLLDPDIKYIDNKSSFWSHVRCGQTTDNVENNWEHWSVSCNNSAPIVPNTDIGIDSRGDLGLKKTEEVQLQSGTGAIIFNSDFCAGTKGDFCICKTGGKDCNSLGFKSIQTCKQGLTSMSDKNNYGCFEHGKDNVDCHPQTPTITPTVIENELTTPSGFSGLNKLGETDIQKLIGRFIRIVIGVIGTIALLMFVYGGLLWMTSAGNAEKTKKAMDIILWSSLGVIVILASYAIVNFVFGLL